MARRKAPRIPDALLDQLLAGADPKTAFEANGLLDDLKKALAERALNAEMDHHLACDDAGNSRNGYGRKTVTTETGRIELEIPRDRQATLDPQLIAKYQRRFPGFDDKIVSMYARGMTVREIPVSSADITPWDRPEADGCAERFIRTLKENLLWVCHFATVEELRLAPREAAPVPDLATPEPVGDEGRVVAALGHDPVDIDTLVRRTSLTPEALYAILLALELDGRVSRLPGGRLQRL